MAVTAPTSRSDVRQLREEKKRREEEARRKEEERKADEGKRRPSIGYPGPKKDEGPKAPFDFEQSQRNLEENQRRGLEAQSERRKVEQERNRRVSENTDRVNSQMGRMTDVARESQEEDKREKLAAKRSARETARSLAPTVKQGIDALGQLSNLGTMTGAVRGGIDAIATAPKRQAIRDAIPEMPEPDNRTPGQRVDAQGPFANPADIERRGKARELEEDLQGSLGQYKPAYAEYTRRASALGIDAGDQMSLPEFAQDMMGVQAGEDGMGLEKVAPGVSPGQATRNIQPAPLNLDGEVGMQSNQGDKDNAGRIRDIISGRQQARPGEPIPEGMRAAESATRRDPYSGAPMTEGSGTLIAPSLNSDGSVGAQQFTRAIPPEIQEQADQLPTAAERDMYIAQSMGVDLSKYPKSQREAVARKFVSERRQLEQRGNMVPAVTDPKTGFFVDPKTGKPILDENGQPIESNVPSAVDEDDNIVAGPTRGSAAPVFIRGTEARQRGAQRKKFNSAMQRAESKAGNASVSQFLTVDPDTGRESLDIAAFEQRFPGSLPPEGDPQRADAIEKLTSMAMRGKAVKQNSDRLGRAQMYASPTFGPMLMMESLQQAETPEEKLAIANYFNRPDLVQLFQEQAMGDRSILKAEKEAEAAAAMRSAGRGGDVNIEGAGAGSVQYAQRMASGQLKPGGMANELQVNGVPRPEAMRQEAVVQVGNTIGMQPPDVVLNAGNVSGWLNEQLERAVPEKGFIGGLFDNDYIRGGPGEFGILDDWDTLRDEFIQDIMAQLNIPANKGFEEELGRRFDQRLRATGRRLKESEPTEVGIPDDNQPGTVPMTSNTLGGF